MKRNSRHSKNRNNKRISKKKAVIILFIFILAIIVFVAAFVNNIPKQYTPTYSIDSDTIFSDYHSSNNEYFFDLYFAVNTDYTITNLCFIKDSIQYCPDLDLYVSFDNDKYQLKNIINIIKQKRGVSATSNFINFINDLFAIKINGYLYKKNIAVDNNVYYSNQKQRDWQSIVTNAEKTDFVKVDKSDYVLYKGGYIKIYNTVENDKEVRKNVKTYSNVKVEIYNSTDIDGYGSTVSRILQNLGFTVVRTLSYDTKYSTTTLYNLQNTDFSQKNIIDALGIKTVEKKLPADINSVADYLIILGGDTFLLY
ncbi:MAG: LytR C-terminal domain-containing protein [bacterium]